MVLSILTIVSGVLILLISTSTPVSAGPTSHHQYHCESFSASLKATAVNVDNVALNSTYSGNITVGPAAFRLGFHFCKPSRPTRHSKVLQVLGHGASYTSEYWRFGFKPEVYSYERAALQAGYSVLSFDLLGCGDSEFPDPFLVVQLPLNIQLVIAMLKAVRHGTLAPRHVQMPKFNKIAYLSHSMGSGVLNAVIAEAPQLVDAVVFTGYYHPSGPVNAPTIAMGALEIANQALPNRFGNLSDGYCIIPNRQRFFYSGPSTYEPGALAHDIATQNVVSIGDTVTLFKSFKAAPNFKGHVLAVNGDSDILNCEQPGCTSLQNEVVWYPAAKSWEAHVIANTGHDLNLHKSAPATFALFLNWLERKGF